MAGDEDTAHPSKRVGAQTNEDDTGDLKRAAPLPVGHQNGGEARRSGGIASATAKQRTSVRGRGENNGKVARVTLDA